MIGTLLDRDGLRKNVFKRTLESVPEIDSQCFLMTEDVLTAFMSVISGADSGMEHLFALAAYTINDGALAWLDGISCSNVMQSLWEALARENPIL